MAHVHQARVSWERGEQDFLDRQYSRAHVWAFDGGVEVPASASPQVVKPPRGREDAVDPEEAVVAAASSCHMLTFLDLAARQGFRIDRYVDEAEAVMGKRADGRTALVGMTLRPAITFSGDKQPTADEIEQLHKKANELCFIANSLNFPVRHEPSPAEFV